MGQCNYWKRAYVLLLLSAAAAIASPAQTFTTLHSFDYTDGQAPYGLVQATNGYFYGTTYSGGANDDGTVFKITPTGTLTMLHSFTGRPPMAGLTPMHGLQNHPKRHADDSAQLRRNGRRQPLCGASPGHRWEPLRDHRLWRRQHDGLRRHRLWDRLQNRPDRHGDHALQLLLAKRLHGR
jgi:uncharacterized repeat protein (TIGR03803 family)